MSASSSIDSISINEMLPAPLEVRIVRGREAHAALGSPKPDLDQTAALARRLVAHWRLPVLMTVLFR
jgi:hypothetical protein